MHSASSWLAVLRRAAVLREVLVGWLLAALLLMPVPGGGQEVGPSWWSTRGVILPGVVPDDYAALNQGQLKNLVAAAVAEMNVRLTGGAGSGLNSLVSSWNGASAGADDYAVVNVGQLKGIRQAKPL